MAGGGDDVDFEDIFGDYQSGDEAEEANAGQKRPLEQAAEPSSSSQAAAPEPAKRARRGGEGAAAGGFDPSRFFEIEAEEAGEGSGDEDDAGDLEGLIDDTGAPTKGKKFNMRSELQRAANTELDEVRQDMESRGPESGARRVFGGSFLDRMQDKYERLEQAGQDHEQHRPMRPADFSRLPKEVTTTHIVPAPQDPKLWRCKSFADEKQLCTSLMLKAADMMAKGKTVNVFSIFYSQHQRGYIYVEAFREAEVREFCKGIRGISPWSIVVVPNAQMPQVFTSAVTDAELQTTLQVGDFVRYKRSPYTGDLAQIEDINDEEYVIKLKPRIQYRVDTANKESKKNAKRTAARWFNKTDLEAAGVMVNFQIKASSKGNLTFYLVNEDLFRDGYLFKTVKMSALDYGDQVRPQEHELQDWRMAPGVSKETRPEQDIISEKEDDKKLMPPPSFIPAKVAEPTELVEGDIVVVNVGELRNLRGRVVKALFRSNTVTVRPLDVPVDQDLELAVSTLCKYFEIGDYVKATAGANSGETGYVMKLKFTNEYSWHKDSTALVLNLSMTTEFEVRLDHLQLTAERPEAIFEKDNYELEALVILPGHSVARGVITRIESAGAGIAEVLMSNGERDRFSFSELAPVPSSQRGLNAIALDRLGQKLGIKHIVKAPRGRQLGAPVRAEIMYIYGEILFLKATEDLTGERKYLACPSRRTELIYDADTKALEGRVKEKKKDKASDNFEELLSTEVFEKEDDELKGKLGFGVTMASEAEWLTREFKEKLFGIEPGGKGKGKGKGAPPGFPVRIIGGTYKGLRAEVRASLGTKVRLLLLCKAKLVTLPVELVSYDDYNTAVQKGRLKRKPKWSGAHFLGQGAPEPLAAPGTPIAQGVLEQPASLAPVDAKEDAPLDEDNSWDPSYLLRIKEDKKPDEEVPEKVDDAAPEKGEGAPVLPVSAQDDWWGEKETAPEAASPAGSAKATGKSDWWSTQDKSAAAPEAASPAGSAKATGKPDWWSTQDKSAAAPEAASPAVSTASSRRSKRQSILPGTPRASSPCGSAA